MAEPDRHDRPERLFWTARISLTVRILAVNFIALGLLAGSVFYLDSYRKQLIAERNVRAGAEAQIVADALAAARRSELRALVGAIGSKQKVRLRLYDRRGRLRADSFELAEPSFVLPAQEIEPWHRLTARWLDRGTDLLLNTPEIAPHVEPEEDSEKAWPEVTEARETASTIVRYRHAPDATPVISAAVTMGTRGEVLLTTRLASGIVDSVRDARRTLAIVVGAALLVSILLSLFLARTIVQPLRALVRAAVRVRLGRDREVVVPRLPERGDEIGTLARAISDMTAALRQRIDAVDAFAADVAHEIKNPLASLRSALESLDKVKDEDLRRQLMDIASHDVRRIDRLITDISEMSRIDAELSRAEFEPVDMVRLVRGVLSAREERLINGACRIELDVQRGALVVPGVGGRLQRVIENLLDNAVSFSPPGGVIAVRIWREDGRVIASISDEGPGIPVEAREAVFERFHSLRPEGEDFGRHSGLGLAIARAIAEGHDGALSARDRTDGKPGACLVLDLPDWDRRR